MSKRFGTEFSLLKDKEFLDELENDCVDSDILEEELQDLYVEPRLTVRQRIVKFLQSQPVQVILCVLVLLDAGIVIAQILLDLHYYRGKHNVCENHISRLLHEMKTVHPHIVDIRYDGNNMEEIISSLRTAQAAHQSIDSPLRTKPNHPRTPSVDLGPNQLYSHTQIGEQNRTGISSNTNLDFVDNNFSSLTDLEDVTSQMRSLIETSDDHQSGGISQIDKDADTVDQTDNDKFIKTYNDLTNTENELDNTSNISDRNVSSPDKSGTTKIDTSHQRDNITSRDVENLHTAAVNLHLVSIAILGFLVAEDVIKAIVMGRQFCRHRVEVCDAVIITSSFVLDLVFMGGVSGEEEGKAAVILVILLLWRIARVVDGRIILSFLSALRCLPPLIGFAYMGIVVTVKQRQEMRIRLQKRARRRAEKRLDILEEERLYKSRHIHDLKELCCRLGIADDDINACAPKRNGAHLRNKRKKRKSSTAVALNNVAQLSVSMTMSISSGLFSLVEDIDRIETYGKTLKPSMSETSVASLTSDCDALHNSDLRHWKFRCISPAGSSSTCSEKTTCFNEPSVHNEDGHFPSSLPMQYENSGQQFPNYCTEQFSPVNNSGVRIVIDSSEAQDKESMNGF